MVDINELRRLAEAAAPGPWNVDGCGDVFADRDDAVFEIDNNPNDRIGTSPKWSNGNPNSAFIAAANPAAVIEILDLVTAMSQDLDWQTKRNNTARDENLKLMEERAKLVEELLLARKVIHATDSWLDHGSRENESNIDYSNWLKYHEARKRNSDIKAEEKNV